MKGAPKNTSATQATARYGDLVNHHTDRQIDRLFLISLRRRYLYCPLSKVANSSIKAFLYTAEMTASDFQYRAERIQTSSVHDILYGPLLLPYQLPYDMIKRIILGKTFFKFIFVRDPAERLVSCYLDRVRAPGSVPHRTVMSTLGLSSADDLTFSEFVRFISGQSVKEMDPHWRPQYFDACCDVIEYDDIFRFENFSTDMRVLLSKLYPQASRSIDLSDNFSPSVTNARKCVSELVTCETRSLIEEVYRVDYENFGY